MPKIYKPDLYKFKGDPKYYIGCDGESPRKIYFSKKEMLDHSDDHAFISAFDGAGELIDEVKIVDYEPDRRPQFDIVDHDGAKPDGHYFLSDF